MLRKTVSLLVLFWTFCLVAHAEPSPSRYEEIRDAVAKVTKENILKDISLRQSLNSKGIAWSGLSNAGNLVVELNYKTFLALPGHAQNFILYHELGHIYLGHVYLKYPGAEKAYSYEIEADAFAALLFSKFNFGEPIMDELSQWLDTDKEHLGQERIDLIRKSLFEVL